MISSPSLSAPEGFFAKRARLHRIAARFDCPLTTRAYIIGKLAVDPAYTAVLDHVRSSDLPIVDIGCGLGLLAHWLREKGCNAPLHGYDFDERKILMARAAADRAGLNNAQFEVGDITSMPQGAAHFVLLDVLHYIDPGARENLLRDLAGRIRADGSVLIRTAVRDGSWRHRATLVEEWWARWSGWIPATTPVDFPTAGHITAPFEAANCRCDIRPLWGRTPFNSHLIVATANSGN